MCDLNWCPVCDKAISCESDSLYCSITCFQCDAENCSNHSFHNFLAPKSSSPSFTRYNNNKIISFKGDDDMPDLSGSIYTSSKASSSSSIFTRRSDLVSRGLIKINDNNKKDEEEVACCDYCENLKGEQQYLLSPPLSWSKRSYSKNTTLVMLSVK